MPYYLVIVKTSISSSICNRVILASAHVVSVLGTNYFQHQMIEINVRVNIREDYCLPNEIIWIFFPFVCFSNMV